MAVLRAVFLLCVASLAARVNAGNILPREAILSTEINHLVQSIAVDSDVFILWMQTRDFDAPLQYHAVTSEDSWTGSLEGNVAGLPIDVSYTGFTTGGAAPEVAFDSHGTFGGHSWQGKGTGQALLAHDSVLERTIISISDLSLELTVDGIISAVISWSISAYLPDDMSHFRTTSAIGTAAGVVQLEGGFEHEGQTNDPAPVLLTIDSYVRGTLVGGGSFEARNPGGSGNWVSESPVESDLVIKKVPESGSLTPTLLVLVGLMLWRRQWCAVWSKETGVRYDA